MQIKIPKSCVVSHPELVTEGELKKYTSLCINLDSGAGTTEEKYLGELLLSPKRNADEYEVYDRGKLLYSFKGKISSSKNQREFSITVSEDYCPGPNFS